MLQDLLKSPGHTSWLYREGKTREVYALETRAKFFGQYPSPLSLASDAEKVAYIRGYFNAEGGLPSSMDRRFYIQFVQKNLQELIELKQILGQVGIATGKIHNPSVRIDPEYFRFFIFSRSNQAFITKVGSWHPRKKPLLDLRMKI
jgi:hypothetical protein